MPAQIQGSPYGDLYSKYQAPTQDTGVLNPTLGNINKSAQSPLAVLPKATVTGPTQATVGAITGPNQSVAPTNPTAAAATGASSINTVNVTSQLPDYLQAIAGSLSSLLTPANLPVGLSGKEEQGLLNQNTLNVGGQNEAALEQAKESLGRAGTLPGESGAADSAIAQIIRQGQSNLAGSTTAIQNQAIQNRAAQAVAAAQTQQGQLNTLSGLMSALYPSAQFAQQFPYQQQQDALSQLQALYGNTTSASSSDWSSYLSSLGSIIG